MATTSLAQQLKKLALPQTNLLEQDKKRPSLLFDPKEAGALDRSAVFSIGVNGFVQLQEIDDKFSKFKQTLFSQTACSFERAVQSQQANDKLNRNIKQFLLLLSPHFLIKPAQQALEWLINRFYIHQYNRDDLFALILPYHETGTFVRCLQIMNIQDEGDKWHWLYSIQKAGVILPKSAIINHCAANVEFLRFICDITIDKVNEIENAKVLVVEYAFYCTTIMGALENANEISEQQVTNLLPSIFKGLVSLTPDFQASAYMLTAQLILKASLKEKLLNEMLLKIITNVRKESAVKATMLLVFAYQTHIAELKYMSTNLISNLMSADWFIESLQTLVAAGARVTALIIAVFSNVIRMAQQPTQESHEIRNFAAKLLEGIYLDTQSAEILIRLTIAEFIDEAPQKEQASIPNGCAENIYDGRNWYISFIRLVRTKYPEEFDNASASLVGQQKSNLSLIEELTDLGQEVRKIQGRLCHSNSQIRAKEVANMAKLYGTITDSGQQILKEPLLDRLTDDAIEVVTEFLNNERSLFKYFPAEDLFERLLQVLYRSEKMDSEWSEIIPKILHILCTGRLDIPNVKLFVAIFPFLFPTETFQIPKIIFSSRFAIKFCLLNKIKVNVNSQVCNSALDLADIILSTVCKGTNLDINELVDVLLNFTKYRNDCLHKYLSLTLLCESIPTKCPPEISSKILEIAIRYIEESQVSNCDGDVLMSIKQARDGHINIAAIIHLFLVLTKKTEFSASDSINDLIRPGPSSLFWVKFFDYLLLKINDNADLKDIYIKILLKLACDFINSKVELIQYIGKLYFVNELSHLTEPKFKVSAQLQVSSLRFVHSVLTDEIFNPDPYIDFETINVIPILLISCMSQSNDVREMGVNILSSISKSFITLGMYNYVVKEVLKRRNEILMDSEQITLILYTIIAPDISVQNSIKLKKDKIAANNVLTNWLNLIGDENHPLYYVMFVMKLMFMINSKEICTKCAELGCRILENCPRIGECEYNILTNIFSKFNTDTLHELTAESGIWKFIDLVLTKHELVVASDCNRVEHPTVILFKTFDKDLFAVLPESIQRQLLKLIINVGTVSGIVESTAAASRLMKRIDLNSELIKDTLIEMLSAKSKQVEMNEKRRRRASNIPSIDILDTNDWRKGITLLEFIQNKKKLINVTAIIPTLFDILKKCLDFEEQAPLEYTKQLILSCILNCCQKLSPSGTQWTASNAVPETMFNVELVVQCIRASQNPQTHHHALLLLSHTAAMIPKQVLHHTMAIFTFMGSSVLRHDDAYSFQIITKIIDNVIPILVGSDCLADDLSEEDADALISKVTPILRVFVDVLLDVPVHRRNPLYEKLLTKLGEKSFLWVFLTLVFEALVSHSEPKNTSEHPSLLGMEESPKRIDIVKTLCSLFSPDIILHTFIKLIQYLQSLPKEKENLGPSHENLKYNLFDCTTHSPKEFRHFRYITLNFVSDILKQPEFVNSIDMLPNESMVLLEAYYKRLIISVLGYIHVVSKYAEQSSGMPQGKYWKVMLHHSYDLLDNVNCLLRSDMFILVVRGLMSHNLAAVRRKALELLNNKLQRQETFFNQIDNTCLFGLLDPLSEIISTISENNTTSEIDEELNQQTALITIKLLSKRFAYENPDIFRPIMNKVVTLIKNNLGSSNVLASLLLCLSELCSSLRIHALYNLSTFMPILMKLFRDQKQKEVPDILFLALVTTIYKVVDTLALFLNPYFEKILTYSAIFLVKWSGETENPKVGPIVTKLKAINQKIAISVPHRVLIPTINHSYSQLLRVNGYDGVGYLMEVLAENIRNLENYALKVVLPELTAFFLSALQFRSDNADDHSVVDINDVSKVEAHIVRALVALVLKLSESTFKPLYFKIFDWATRNTEHPDRAITFYRLSYEMADCLKGLFVLFAGNFVNHAATLLTECNHVKSDKLIFTNEEKCILLLKYIMKTLHTVFLHDNQNFINKERFEILMQPMVDQLENTIGGIDRFQERATEILIPCIAQFAVASADDSVWKQLNYQVLLKTRHNLPAVRLASLQTVCLMGNKLGEDFLPLLPETIPFLAELLEDEDEAVELACQKAVQELEKVLGEPLQKYF